MFRLEILRLAQWVNPSERDQPDYKGDHGRKVIAAV